jgi:hypothetical protein
MVYDSCAQHLPQQYAKHCIADAKARRHPRDRQKVKGHENTTQIILWRDRDPLNVAGQPCEICDRGSRGKGNSNANGTSSGRASDTGAKSCIKRGKDGDADARSNHYTSI